MSYSLPSGTKLGDGYEIRGVLGSGGFGITYQAWDVEFHRLVAIKEYFPFDLAIRASGSDSVVSRDAGTKDDLAKGMVQFVEEGRTLAKFADDRIVRATNFVKANDTVYMVMEYQEGRSLSEFLAEQKRPLSEQEVLNIFVPIMQALEKVHRASILHRDLKPDNIYIRNDGAPLLLDFGAARQKVLGKSRSLTSMLSPGYAPLEQYHARGNQGPWTDIYALGATMYFCATGKKPENVTARVGASNAGIPDPMPPAVQAGAQLYSETLLSTIDWMLELNERQRPQSLSEVLTRLSGIGSQPESGGVPGAVQTRIAPANVLQKNEINPTKTEIYEYKSSDAAQHSSGRKKPVVLIAAVGLLVVLLAGIGFTQWSKWADTPKNAERQLLPEETPGEVARVNSEQEETARLAEEKRQKEEATRLAVEQRRKAEAARIAEEQRQKEETARLAEEKRQEVEEASWRMAEGVNTRASYRAYLGKYGAGKYAKAARTRIGKIEKAKADRLAEEERRLEEEKRQQQESARLTEQQRKKEETKRLAGEKKQKDE
jgi:serine/threonine protein kinase